MKNVLVTFVECVDGVCSELRQIYDEADCLNLFSQHVFIRVKKLGKYGLCSVSKEVILPVEYDDIIKSNLTGIITVVKNGRCGVLSRSGDRLDVPIDYDHVWTLTETLWGVRRDGLWGIFSSSSQKLVLPIEYDDLVFLNHHLGLILVNKKGLNGLFNVESMELFIPAKYQDIKLIDSTKIRVTLVSDISLVSSKT